MTVLTTARWRFRTVGAALLLLLASMTACNARYHVAMEPAGDVSSTRPITIGYSPLNQSNELMRGLGAGLKAYAATRGAEVIIADPANDAATQVRQLEEWIERRQVQAIWALPVDAAALVPVLAKARANDIVVLATGTPQDYGHTDLTVGTSYSFINYLGYGEDVGRVLGQCANARLGGRARVLYLHNPAGTVGAGQFGDGLRKGLAATSPGSTIVSVMDSRVDRSVSREATLSAVEADAGIDAVAGANDDAMLGALDGLSQTGRTPARSCVAGAGGGDKARAEVGSGSLYAVVAWQYEQDLTQNVDQMLQMVGDPQAVGLQLLSPIETIRK